MHLMDCLKGTSWEHFDAMPAAVASASSLLLRAAGLEVSDSLRHFAQLEHCMRRTLLDGSFTAEH